MLTQLPCFIFKVRLLRPEKVCLEYWKKKGMEWVSPSVSNLSTLRRNCNANPTLAPQIQPYCVDFWIFQTRRWGVCSIQNCFLNENTSQPNTMGVEGFSRKEVGLSWGLFRRKRFPVSNARMKSKVHRWGVRALQFQLLYPTPQSRQSEGYPSLPLK